MNQATNPNPSPHHRVTASSKNSPRLPVSPSPRLSGLKSLSLLLLMTLPLSVPTVARAEKESQFETCLFDPSILTDDGLPARSGVLSAYSFSQTNMTIPSLWWARDQFGDRKLVTNWVAYTEEKRIDLIVNLQFWSSLKYIGRYSFIHHFGNVAREYGYNLRVFNQRLDCLATYTCNFEASPPQCELVFDPAARGRWQL